MRYEQLEESKGNPLSTTEIEKEKGEIAEKLAKNVQLKEESANVKIDLPGSKS